MKTDVQLTTAHHNLLSLDHAIAELYDKLGDHVDDNADYIEAEERRFEALENLATNRARSPGGMCAKAKALKAASVADDIDRRAAVATSLANDVLQHFGHAA